MCEFQHIREQPRIPAVNVRRSYIYLHITLFIVYRIKVQSKLLAVNMRRSFIYLPVTLIIVYRRQGATTSKNSHSYRQSISETVIYISLLLSLLFTDSRVSLHLRTTKATGSQYKKQLYIPPNNSLLFTDVRVPLY